MTSRFHAELAGTADRDNPNAEEPRADATVGIGVSAASETNRTRATPERPRNAALSGLTAVRPVAVGPVTLFPPAVGPKTA